MARCRSTQKFRGHHDPGTPTIFRRYVWCPRNWGLLIRYDKHDVNYLGLIQLAYALLWYRRVYRLQAA